ncbi:glycosyl transferase family 39 [Dyella amyloliquefaciens]|uniref:glycosyl transferase family 39 n=1 Tax=Dyella amyloliquefaciens TaxID=1770545 RepID=UPI00102EAD6E|nr:glycosyl transferase family 39 [Dyella amyloliquefaciens]
MRQLVTFLLLIGAVAAYTTGFGPLFFGAPLVGYVLVAMGLILEVAVWRRALHPVRR